MMKRNSFLAQPLHKKIWIVLGVAFFLWVMLCAPTGWIYDLGDGTGTEQGQMPVASVSAVQDQADVEEFFFQDTQATVQKEGLVQCPLLRLRDIEYAGKHTSSRKRTVVISEYISMAYPISPVRRLLVHFLGAGVYNGYYLAPLEDGSYVCVYFDDYLLMGPGDLPTGYVRYTTTEERNMLRQMKEDYAVNPVYVLDMYRHGKVSWIVDYLLRFAAAIFVIAAVSLVLDRGKKSAGQES